ncbi:MAG: DMT family transporter, partial [Muribaculaceae bacterium]|nr:DMT family transporter [Muribaculaceae bacterium]
SSLFITRKLFFYGVLTALPLLFLQHEPYHLHLLFDFKQPQYLMNLGFLVIMCSVAAYLIWNEVMKILGSVTASNYLYLQPIVTMVAAYFVFGEQVYLLGYIGCALIIGGLIMADKLDLDKKLKK